MGFQHRVIDRARPEARWAAVELLFHWNYICHYSNWNVFPLIVWCLRGNLILSVYSSWGERIRSLCFGNLAYRCVWWLHRHVWGVACLLVAGLGHHVYHGLEDPCSWDLDVDFLDLKLLELSFYYLNTFSNVVNRPP